MAEGTLQDEIEQLKLSNETLKKELNATQDEVQKLKYGDANLELGSSIIDRIREKEAERHEFISQMNEKLDSGLVQQLIEKGEAVKTLLELEKTQDYEVRENSNSFFEVFHNASGGRHNAPFEVKYTHTETLKNIGDYFEVRIDDIGEKWEKAEHEFDIGVGVINAKSNGGNNRKEYGFDLGCLSSDQRVLHLLPADKRRWKECPDSVVINGDIMTCMLTPDGIIATRNHKTSVQVAYGHDGDFEYEVVIGMNNPYAKVTLAFKSDFQSRNKQYMESFPKKDLRIYTCSINEGSPNYASGVKKGGSHLLKDGTLVRRIRESGRRVINFEPGCAASTYDAKFGGDLVLSDLFFGNLKRNRTYFGGNMVNVKKQGTDDFYVHIKSCLTGREQRFSGSDAEWRKERGHLLSYGEKYLIDLPMTNGMIHTSDLLIAGTKCKTVANMMYETLQHKVEGSNKTPVVAMLGGDRIQSVGSITGAVRAYDDLCVVFFDGHFDFRDPDASEYPIVHGSPLYFLLQEHLREAIHEWEGKSVEEKDKFPKTKEAIRFIQSTKDGKNYWKSLKDTSKGYRGFNWLCDAKKLNHQRIAFCGARGVDIERGSSQGSPLVTLFMQLLQMQNSIYTKEVIASEGVEKVFSRIVKQFRGTFKEEYLAEKDAQFAAENPDAKDKKWIPPIFVSWDVDSIDPEDMPCTIFPEPNGLVAEECLAFSDEVARTNSLIGFEIVEFNPDLWGGYRDEPMMWTINEFEAGCHARAPKPPSDKNKHTLDLQKATSLIHQMIVRLLDPCIEIAHS